MELIDIFFPCSSRSLLLFLQPAGWSNFGEVTVLTQAAYKKVLSQFLVSLRSSHSINMVSE